MRFTCSIAPQDIAATISYRDIDDQKRVGVYEIQVFQIFHGSFSMHINEEDRLSNENRAPTSYALDINSRLAITTSEL